MADDAINLSDMEERAQIVADATGRKVEDVIIDLLDDGEANFSAGTDSKDMLDIAQEKAEKLKTLLITLMPIIALLGAGGLEGLGLVDVTGWGEDSVWDDDPYYPEPEPEPEVEQEPEPPEEVEENATAEPEPEPEPDCTPYLFQSNTTSYGNGTIRVIMDIDTDCESIEVNSYLDVSHNGTYLGYDEVYNFSIIGQDAEPYLYLYYNTTENGTHDLYISVYYNSEQAIGFERIVEID